eukprot:TRINITY_DN7336_c0_g1_i1.p1 TRINITY_DN7336_c0_g1~~TRINITY_DN7336_c0_g1_i1.p1  ORF type:complete len:217 (-),score=30.57 TRINITY_DN7336_c0_g1_i1:43-693(-)
MLMGFVWVWVWMAVAVVGRGAEGEGREYYGRCFGVAESWYRKDSMNSHHLEVNFTQVADLDNGLTYHNFQANIDIESFDGSSLLVVSWGPNDVSNSGLLSKLSSGSGLKKITATQGLSYDAFLKADQFQHMPEGAYTSLLESLLSDASQVFLFGQVYHDNDGAVGIHDIHRITTNGYGDGALFTQDKSGNFHAIFAHFSNQPRRPPLQIFNQKVSK